MKNGASPDCIIVVVVVVSDAYESVCMCTSPQTCKLHANQKRCAVLETWACTASQGITLLQSCHVQELFSHKHDHNAS